MIGTSDGRGRICGGFGGLWWVVTGFCGSSYTRRFHMKLSQKPTTTHHEAENPPQGGVAK